jgi:hypothetical protein
LESSTNLLISAATESDETIAQRLPKMLECSLAPPAGRLVCLVSNSKDISSRINNCLGFSSYPLAFHLTRFPGSQRSTYKLLH